MEIRDIPRSYDRCTDWLDIHQWPSKVKPDRIRLIV